jgi:hypothetical protein
MGAGGDTGCKTFEVTAVSIIRVGATKKYSDGWLSAFGKGKKQAAPAVSASAKKTAKKSAAKPAKASAKKKSSGKKAKKK